MSHQTVDKDTQRQAAIDFMLGKKVSVATTPLPTPRSSTTMVSPTSSSAYSKAKLLRKKYSTILQAFYGSLTRDWLSVDDQALQVVRSIANLRERCWLTSRSLAEQQQQQQSSEQIGQPSWKKCGYRSSSNSGSGTPASLLLPEDLELTLSDELLQHEKMMAGLRRLLGQLGQAQEALGRRLDELLLYHMGNSFMLADDTRRMDEMAIKVEECQQLFTATASELYRKQTLAEQLFESVQDSLLYGSGKEIKSDDASPRRIGRQCADRWPRNSKESMLYHYNELLARIPGATV